jgi:cytochrome P450
MPFGGGARICIGQRFAMIEATMILATMAQQFSMELQRHREITPFPSITLRPTGGVWARLQERAILSSVDAKA